ncbi:MAG: methyltransferase family protein [Acidimicrobiia bacterium]
MGRGRTVHDRCARRDGWARAGSHGRGRASHCVRPVPLAGGCGRLTLRRWRNCRLRASSDGRELAGRDRRLGSYELVCHGLFRVVRNPFYLGIILAVAGVVLMVPSVVAALGWIAVVLGCEIDVRLVEEPHLSKALGPRYREYAAAATGRFLPGLGRRSRS